jgi:ABC-type lipoprotein release transport system permease subunit
MTTDLDRNYYRACSDSALVEMARDSDSELALVLGEALAEALSVRKNDSNYIDALEANVARLERDLRNLQDAVDLT